MIAVAALAISPVYPTLSALIFILASVSLIALRPIDNALVLTTFGMLLLLPLLACLSAMWSDAPSRTLRAGLQLFITFSAAIIVAKRCPPELLIGTLLLSIMAIGLQIMSYIPPVLGSGHPLRGPFGSKNALGFCAQLGVLLAFATMLNPQMPRILRIASVVFLPYFVWLISLSQSAGALTSSAIFLFVFFASMALGRFPTGMRWAAAALLLLVLAVLFPFLADLTDAIAGAGTQALGKNTTLTGRTHLWDIAEQFSERRPLLGYGFNAFWRQGNIEAETLWRSFGIASRMGFNFHNEFIEIRVAMGYVGLVILAATCIGIFLFSIYRQLSNPSVTIAFFLALQTALYARSFAEDGLVAPFSESTVLWIASAVYTVAWVGSAKPVAAAIRKKAKAGREALRLARDTRIPRRT
ncbi:MAG: O-antigen ligase family protein [Novosphingobium sp.]